LNTIGEALFQTYISQHFHTIGDTQFHQQEEQQQQMAFRAATVTSVPL
jgi:hypothetical protein